MAFHQISTGGGGKIKVSEEAGVFFAAHLQNQITQNQFNSMDKDDNFNMVTDDIEKIRADYGITPIKGVEYSDFRVVSPIKLGKLEDSSKKLMTSETHLYENRSDHDHFH